MATNWGGPELTPYDNWLGSVLGTLRGAANTVIGFIKRLWDYLYNHFLKAILNALIHHKGKLWTVLQKVHDFIVKIRDYERRNFDLYVRPILNFIQRLRGALLIFRIFHMKWAAALDSRLADMEGQLARLWLNTLGQFNRILGYFDYMVNPFGLFRTGRFLWSAIKSIGDLFGILYHAQNRPLGAADLAAQDHDAHLFDRDSLLTNSQLTAVTGLQPDYRERRDDLWAILSDMGYKQPGG